MMMTDDTLLCSRAAKSLRSLKSFQNFDAFGPPKVFGVGFPKRLMKFYKSESPLNMWQSLMIKIRLD